MERGNSVGLVRVIYFVTGHWVVLTFTGGGDKKKRNR